MIYLGNASDVDTNESTLGMESPDSLLGTYGSAGAPLWQERVVVNGIDGDDNARYATDSTSGLDTLEYDLGAGSITTQIDAVGVFAATVQYGDGTSGTGNIALIQDTAGNLFLLPWASSIAGVVTKPIDSVNLTSSGSSSFSGVNTTNLSGTFVCLGTGTRVATPGGPCAIETLSQGDIVSTVDDGPQPLLWHGVRVVNFTADNADQRPYEIKPGTLAPDRPTAPLVVSPQHRILIQTGTEEALVPAKALAGHPGVRQMKGKKSICYHALLFSRHQILTANGMQVESLFPGDWAMKTLTPMQQLAVISHIPQILNADSHDRMQPAHPFAIGKRARAMLGQLRQQLHTG